tara:strand:+ start:700 stop:915 length:216 start_codon:yes stop_codon:yes gene_type:complete
MAHLLQELCKTPDFKPYELSLDFLDSIPPYHKQEALALTESINSHVNQILEKNRRLERLLAEFMDEGEEDE